MFVKASLLILSALFAGLASAQNIGEKTCFECVNNYKYWDKSTSICSFTSSASRISQGIDCFKNNELSRNTSYYEPFNWNSSPIKTHYSDYKEVNLYFFNKIDEPVYIALTCSGFEP